MTLVYNLLIHLYSFGIRIASLFNKKAKFWISGRRNLLDRLKLEIDSSSKLAWFHCASLGEFEQAKPVIEGFREDNPNYKILLTFFSPSGYENRKNYKVADYIFYLPSDTVANSRKFISIVNPNIVFFVKYEFWYNYISLLYKRDIPVILFSSIFRDTQIFFKPWGRWNRKILKYYKHIFVQNNTSRLLLDGIGIKNVTVSGDTRYDRVYQIALQEYHDNVVESFVGSSYVIVAGSTWPQDEDLLQKLWFSDKNIKLIIAPHEIEPSNINRLLKLFGKESITYSSSKVSGIGNENVMIIDNIGMLSSIYKYGNIAYVGGAFKTGLHNILEPAAHGKPIIFGPEYKKFQEAISLLETEAAFSIKNFNDLKYHFQNLYLNRDIYDLTSQKALKFVKENLGSTTLILDFSYEFII